VGKDKLGNLNIEKTECLKHWMRGVLVSTDDHDRVSTDDHI
jgi:hypothetical protein